jgi:hypothetical protein
MLERLAHDAGAERASRASDYSSRHSAPVLGAEVLGRFHNGTCRRIKTFIESSVISRRVVGTLGESSGNRHWRYRNHANIRPEFAFILHLLFSSLMRSPGNDRVWAASSGIPIGTRQHRQLARGERTAPSCRGRVHLITIMACAATTCHGPTATSRVGLALSRSWGRHAC